MDVSIPIRTINGYVDCDCKIKFRPHIVPQTTYEEIVVNQINAMLGGLAHEISDYAEQKAMERIKKHYERR